jgi:segregation and condensation protein B
MNKEKLKNIIEAALMAAEKPLSVARLASLFENDLDQPSRSEIRAVLDELKQGYEGHGIECKEVASGFRFQVRNDYAEWINRLYDERPPRYSRALLETLAIIAYRQPLTRAEIEDIRGVSVSSSIVKTLQEREWIRVVGHRDVPGKPELLATTKEFLDYFNLIKLSDLPPLSEIKDIEQINRDLFEVFDRDTTGNNEEHQKIKIQVGDSNVQDDLDTDLFEDDSEDEAPILPDDDKVVPITH